MQHSSASDFLRARSTQKSLMSYIVAVRRKTYVTQYHNHRIGSASRPRFQKDSSLFILHGTYLQAVAPSEDVCLQKVVREPLRRVTASHHAFEARLHQRLINRSILFRLLGPPKLRGAIGYPSVFPKRLTIYEGSRERRSV